MSLINETLNEEVRGESILAKLEATEAPGAVEAQPDPVVEPVEPPAEQIEQAPVVETADPGAAETPPTAENDGQSEPETPAIAPPKFMKAEYRDRWKDLPTDWQRYLAQQEEENSRTVSTKLEEAAAARRAAEATKKEAEERAAAAAQEQQRYAQQLQIVAQQLEAADPIVAAYRNTDLQRLARENPAQYTELDAAYKVRVRQIEAVRAEQVRVQQEAARNWIAREQTALIAAVPEWSDATKRQTDLAELRNVMASSYGYKPEEIEAVSDHRHVRVIKDAMEVQKLRTEVAALRAAQAEREKVVKQAITEKKVAPATQTRTLKPGAAADASRSQADRSKALINRARGARTLEEKAALIAQLD